MQDEGNRCYQQHASIFQEPHMDIKGRFSSYHDTLDKLYDLKFQAISQTII